VETRPPITLSFRCAAAADAPALVALIQSAYRGEESRAGWTTEADLLEGTRTDVAGVRAVIDAPRRCMIVGEADGELIACCQLEARPGATA
jgi:hypothetical protein